MAEKNIKVFIRRPGGDTVNKLTFTTYDGDDVVRIPRRTPFADILNLADLKTAGYIRGESQNVATELGGANAAGSLTNLGLQLPRTEKLILLAKNPAVTTLDITLTANTRAGIEEKTLVIPAGVIGDIYEIDLFDLGFHIESNQEGSVKLTPSKDVGLVLVARY